MKSKTGPKSRSQISACMSSAGGGITSGGGFGNLTYGGGPTPAWQLAAVRRYIDSHSHLSSWPMQADVNPGFEYLVSCPANKAADNGTDGEMPNASFSSRGSSSSLEKDNAPIVCTYGRGYPDLSLMGAQASVVVSGIPTVQAGENTVASGRCIPVYGRQLTPANNICFTNPSRLSLSDQGSSQSSFLGQMNIICRDIGYCTRVGRACGEAQRGRPCDKGSREKNHGLHESIPVSAGTWVIWALSGQSCSCVVGLKLNERHDFAFYCTKLKSNKS